MKFPRSPRYANATKAACQFLVQENIKSFPIDPFEIIKKNKWGLITYSELSAENDLSIKQVIKACQSEDAYVMYDGINYTIAYNDTIKVRNRIRFTLMHEIGHIYLNHLIDFDETIMTRNALTKSRYQILENETNHFARNVLAPATIVFRLDLKTVDEIIKYFKLTKAAAITRVQMLARDAIIAANYTIDLWKHFESLINTFVSDMCMQCGFSSPKRKGLFCPICGDSKFTKVKGGNAMIFDGYQLDQNGRALRCPRCDNEEVDTGQYCKICGIHLVNMCTNKQYDRDGDIIWQCDTLAEGNARHCVACGHPTSFLQNKLLERWDKAIESLSKLPF